MFTYKAVFGSNRNVGVAASALVALAGTGCSRTSPVTQSEKDALSKAESDCAGKTGQSYCKCMYDSIDTAISGSHGLTPAQNQSLADWNQAAYDKCKSEIKSDEGTNTWWKTE